MLRISFNVILLTLGSLLLSYGLIHVVSTYMNEDGDQKVLFQTSISHPSLLGGESQRTFIKVDLTGFTFEQHAERAPVNVALVLDKSGSMNGEKMEQAKAAAMQAVDMLTERDKLTIVTYDSHVQVLVPATPVANKSAIKNQIRQIQANGGTALYGGVVTGANQLREYLNGTGVHRVILLSDGQANEGPSTPEELGNLGATLIQDNISVTTIGLGLGYNEDLMVQLAMRSDGNHNFVEHADMLAGVFNQEFGDVMSVVAQDVKVQFNLEEGFRPISVQGREATIDGQHVEVSLNQLYGNQDKYVLLEIETTPEERNGEYEVATVALSYDNVVTEREDQFENIVVAEFTNSQAEVDNNVDAETMVSAIEQQAVMNEERAIRLRDLGKREEAEVVLRQNASYLKENAELYDSDRLSGYAVKSQEAATSLDDAEWKKQRKAMRSDHYKTKTQQNN